MKWVTREHVKVGRIACAWAIRRFVDPEAEILFVPRELVDEVVARESATPFHARGAEIMHRGKQTSFEVLVEKYELGAAPAMAVLSQIVNGADTDNSTFNRPEAAGLRAITDGLGEMELGDEEVVRRGAIVMDALYAYSALKAGS